ncbi:MAG: Potassium uptake protein KtrA [bacterium 42_11]|nr:MAG: Potassium uptake protein KtrA [bacterium 42_11]
MNSLSTILLNLGFEKNKLNNFTVIGLGRFGMAVAIALENLEKSVMAIDKDERKIEEIKVHVSYAKVLDATNIDALRDAGVQDSDVVIVAIGDDVEASVFTTLLAKELGVKLVIARAISACHRKILEKIGADFVVFPEAEYGELLTQKLVLPNIIDFMEVSSGLKIVEIKPPKKFLGKPLEEFLALRDKYDVTLLAIMRGDKILTKPSPQYIVAEEDILYLVGSVEEVNRLVEENS